MEFLATLTTLTTYTMYTTYTTFKRDISVDAHRPERNPIRHTVCQACPSDRRLVAPLWLRGAAADSAVTAPNDDSAGFCDLARAATHMAENTVLPALAGRTDAKCVVQETL